MSTQRVCARCHVESDVDLRVCPACGAPRSRKPLTGMLLGACGLLLVGLLGLFLWRGYDSSSKDLHVAAELKSGTGPAIEIPGVMRVLYRDLGSTIQLSITSKSNPIISVDLNEDRIADKGDVSYSPLAGDRACVAPVGTSDCSSVGTSAKVKVTQVEEARTVTWTISKAELGSGKEFADIVIRTFHENTQQGEYFPAAPFQKVYRLIFLQGTASAAQIETPVATPEVVLKKGPEPSVIETKPLPVAHTQEAPQQISPVIALFEATPNALPMGASTRLTWNVQGKTTSVEIHPDLGAVASQGERDLKPSATTRYILTANGSKGEISRELTVTVVAPPPPVIASFSSDNSAVTPGSVVRLRWNITGPVTSVKLDPIGIGLPASGFRDVTVTQTTNFVLTADGPGGSVSNSSVVRAALQAPAVVFEGTPSTTHAGEPILLHWAVTGANQISIQPGFGEVAPTGSETLRPLASTQYTLVATSAGGSTTRTVTLNVARFAGPTHGQLIWSGEVRGVQLVSIERDRADIGTLEGALPGQPCIVQPLNPKNVSIASSPGPRNQYERLVLRVSGNGPTRVVVNWTLQ